MKKYKLLKDFAGKKAGEILELHPSQGRLGVYYIYITYEKVPITLDSTMTHLLEEVKDEPLFYTNEDEVYLDGKKVPLFNYSKFYYINGLETIDWALAELYKYPKEKFVTKKAAEDYIKLQQAIKDSGLKIGDIINHKGIEFYDVSSGKWYYNNDGAKRWIISFKLLDDKLIAIAETYVNSNKYGYNIKDISKPKSLFRDKEVSLKLWHHENSITKDVYIIIDNYIYFYSELNRNKIFLNKSKEIDNILEECEKLLKS